MDNSTVTYNLFMDGEHNVSVCKKITKGYCYVSLYNHGHKYGQMELVETYNSKTREHSLAITLNYIPEKYLTEAIKLISKYGFRGMCHVSYDDDSEDIFEEYIGSITI